MSARALFIGLDGATFTILDSLMNEGVMPRLSEVLRHGTRGELASVIPPLTPPAWTSLMTGRSPGNHGIFDFLRFEFRAGGQQLRVLDANDVGAPTIWNIAGQHGIRSSVLNFPMTFPVRDFPGTVVPGWVPWRHLRLACYPRSLYDRVSAAIPNFNPRELAMDMALEERALEGCHSEEDYETLINLHIRRERQWFEVARYLMAEEPTDIVAVLFDGVDKLQHFCWRFLDPNIFPASPSDFERKVRACCLQYFREIDGFIGALADTAGADTPLFIASDHGFGPTTEVFFLNEWLHRNGYLVWADSVNVEQKHPEMLGMGTMARRFYEIDWEKTTAYCPTPSSNGIFITPRGLNGAGVSPDGYYAFREALAEKLKHFQDPVTGIRPVTSIAVRDQAFAGTFMESAPDLTLSLRDGGLVSILPSDVLVKPRPETTGAHRPNGVFFARGPGIRKSASTESLSILDVAPTMLHALGIAIPRELEGRVPDALFESGYLDSHPVAFEGTPRSTAAAAGSEAAAPDPTMQEDVIGQLRALGYME